MAPKVQLYALIPRVLPGPRAGALRVNGGQRQGGTRQRRGTTNVNWPSSVSTATPRRSRSESAAVPMGGPRAANSSLSLAPGLAAMTASCAPSGPERIVRSPVRPRHARRCVRGHWPEACPDRYPRPDAPRRRCRGPIATACLSRTPPAGRQHGAPAAGPRARARAADSTPARRRTPPRPRTRDRTAPCRRASASRGEGATRRASWRCPRNAFDPDATRAVEPV